MFTLSNLESKEMNIIVISIFIGSIITSLILNRLLINYSNKNKIYKDQSERWSQEVRPSLGGISFYIIFLILISLIGIITNSLEFYLSNDILGIVLTVSIAFFLGLADDSFNVSPKIKILAQVSSAIILIITNNYIQIFNYQILNYLITIFWVIGIMNSINMLDNMDAITSQTTVFILLTSAITLIIQQSSFTPILIILISVIGTLIGFLYYNWNPAKIFMGDTGSQFLGMLLAFISIRTFWNTGRIVNESNDLLNIFEKFLVIGTLFIIPIIDTTIVSINRIIRGVSPFQGGKDHTSHHLIYLGLNEKKVTLVYSIISVFSLVLITIYYNNILSQSVIITMYSIYFFSLLFLGFYMTNYNTKKGLTEF